jgi:HK97 family phage prohead protease
LRYASAPIALAARADAEPAGEVMTVRFSVFNTWYPISSWWEGDFLERTAPGAFLKTIGERGDQVKVLFNHGYDSGIGSKILGVPSVLREDADAPYAEVPLLDTSYNRDLIPGLAAGGYGSSFMFEVTREEWNREPDASDYNPGALPERTIREVRLFEFGPVTWPANPAATAGLRSMTDWYADQLRERDPARHADMAERFTDFRAQHGLRTLDVDAALRGTSTPGAALPTDAPDTAPAVHHPSGLSAAARARLLAAPFLTQGAPS